MSAGEMERVKRELGMVEGSRATSGAFYEIPKAWLRELIGENEHLRKIVDDLYGRPSADRFASVVRERDELRGRLDRAGAEKGRKGS